MINPFCNIEEAITALKNGQMLILVDDKDRENEGDLMIAAEKVTKDAINFMSKEGRGLICLAMAESFIEKLQLPMMVEKNHSSYETAFTISIDAKKGVSTGISAKDRAKTIQVAIAEDACADDIVSPGHVFPLKAKRKGVLSRAGQTEGSVDLAFLAGFKKAAVICEVMNEDGSMARLPELTCFSQKHGIKMVAIKDLIAYRMQNEALVEILASASLPLEALGDFDIKVFGNHIDDKQHIALIKSPLGNEPLVRIHSECLTGDIFSSAKCDCGAQLKASLKQVAENGGILLYMKQEGRGIGLVNKIKAYALQTEQGLDTVEANNALGFPADKRDYAISAQILRKLGVTALRLLTNNPRKILGLERYGLNVIERVPLVMEANSHNQFYLETKAQKLGHILKSKETFL